MDKALEQEVRIRSQGRCEYCHFPEAMSELRHVIDHIIARQHRGQTVSANLCVCCGRCNRYKGPNISGIDPQTGSLVRLFNPRSDEWSDHFRWNGARLLEPMLDVQRSTFLQ
ncbi:MAG TPA: HNH endonuclease signature motif containing protein [Phycisphaerales bacterium]|jgi:5-methylcytosine-specific restriction endonuclease McrA|nr:HNH endonuclease signature motif containing protein [Phycisphaerales bacterium]